MKEKIKKRERKVSRKQNLRKKKYKEGNIEEKIAGRKEKLNKRGRKR